MDLSDLIAEEAIMPALKAQSKKQALQEICGKAARLSGLSEREIFDTILHWCWQWNSHPAWQTALH